jgi:MFS family permease
MNLHSAPSVGVTLSLTTNQVFLGAVIATFGCALQGGAVNLAMLAVGRAIAGVAVGILSGVIPMYCAEIATAEDRGKLSGLLQLMLSWGFFAAQWIGFGSFHSKSDFQCKYRWRDQSTPTFEFLNR